MPSDRPERNIFARILARAMSRNAILMFGVVVVLLAGFSGFDAMQTRPSDGTVWLLGRPDLEVVEVVERSPTQPATPLQKGDKILGVANRLVKSPQAAAAQLKKQQPGSTVRYLIERDERQFLVKVPLTSSRVVGLSYLLNVLLAVVYLTIGFLVYIKSNNEQPARLFFWLCLLFTLYFMTNVEHSSYFWGAIISQNIGAFARFLLPAVFLLFFLVFPEKKHFLTRHHYLFPLLLLIPFMFYCQYTLSQFFGSKGAHIGPTVWVILGLYFVGGLAALLHGYFSYSDPLLKERVRILTVGTLAAVVPFLVFKIGLEELTANAQLAHLGVVPLLAIPTCFGYCIARYRIMQIDLLLRRSLVYSLLTGFVMLAYLALVFWVCGVVLDIIGTVSRLVSVGVTLALAALAWPLRVRIQRAIDRRFFRSRDRVAEVLEHFSKTIPRLIKRDVLLRSVGGRLCEVLEVPQVSFLAPSEDEENLSWEYSRRIAVAFPDTNPGVTTVAARCPHEFSLAATVRKTMHRGEPFWVDADAAREVTRRQAITREQAELAERLSEQRLLADMGVTLLVPMATGDRLVGLMAMPAKPDGEAYQLYEIRLLTIVAGQVALQLENSRLYEEEVTKQKLEEEMAMARDIQSRLLPGTLPTLKGIDIAAENLSSKQVSGDYYDMIEMDDGQLALVIADVSGKGMPASLLASNLQAALRAVCNSWTGPGLILDRINKQLHASTDPQHFATLFLAIFDPQSNRLRYCSGGHNAPVIVRCDGCIELLEEGGLPLGAFEFGDYPEGEATLQAGDLLFMYTDGVTEARDDDLDEQYGEERLNELLKRHRELPVQDIIEKVHEELKVFSGRLDADDDITVVGLKVVDTDYAASSQAASQ